MRIKLALAILLLIPGLAAAQDKLADQLRKAIVEEEGNQNLDKAIQAYKNILAQFDEERRTAATALFHMADCYRKQGKDSPAIAAYRRIVSEFQDQTGLAEASRAYLTKTYNLIDAPDSDARNQQQVTEARQRYRLLLQQQIQVVETQLDSAQKRVEIGVISPVGDEMSGLKKELFELQRTLAAFDAGAVPIPSISTPVRQILTSEPVVVDAKIMEAKLQKKVDPVCPQMAGRPWMEGVVRLSVIINEQGAPASVKVIGGGFPPCQPAAAEAVRQWRYAPYLDAAGKAITVITTVNLPMKGPNAP